VSDTAAEPIGNLLIDANPVSRRLSSLLLARCAGTAPATAADADSAVPLLLQQRYALILIDTDTLAAEAIAAIRAAIIIERGRPLLVALQSVDTQLSENIAAVFDEVLNKPLSQQLLAPLLRRAASAEAATINDDFNPAIWAELLGLFKAGGVAQLVQALVVDLPEQEQRYQAATAAADLSALRHIAHALRGTSMQLGAAALSRLCTRTEFAAADGEAGPAFELAATMMERHRQLIARLQREAAVGANA
jgi:HPt (histidine-containing phosphotransfer) domain-containing protein